jgi:hypothetical protein
MVVQDNIVDIIILRPYRFDDGIAILGECGTLYLHGAAHTILMDDEVPSPSVGEWEGYLPTILNKYRGHP